MTAGLLDRLRETRLRIVRRIALLALGVIFSAFQICGLVGIRINTSPSLPSVSIAPPLIRMPIWSSSVRPNHLAVLLPAAAIAVRVFVRMVQLLCSSPLWPGRATS